MRVFLPTGTEFWHIDLVTEAGNHRSINTWCRTEDAARAVAAEAKVRELETAGQVHRLTVEVVTLITTNRSITVSQAVAEWDTWMTVAVRSPRTKESNLVTIRSWAREAGLEHASVGSITVESIHNWINCTARPDKLGTRKTKLAVIRAFMRFCVAKRYVLSDHSQLASVNYRTITHEQRETQHKQVFTDEEVDRLIKLCAFQTEPPSLTPGFFRAAIIIGRDLALRLGDICALEWSCFDFEHRRVTVWTDKSNTRIQIPMTDRVAAVVSNLKREDPRFLFLRESAMIGDRRRSFLSVYFARFLKAHGFTGYSFHSLRATMATTMALNGSTTEEIAVALGHNGTNATKSYIRRDGAANLSIAL